MTKEGKQWADKVGDTQLTSLGQDTVDFWIHAFCKTVEQNADKSFSFRVDKTFRTTTEYGYALVDSYNECKKKLLGE